MWDGITATENRSEVTLWISDVTDDNIEISMINTIEAVNFQFDIITGANLEAFIISAHGGIAETLGYNVVTNPEGLVLGYSLSLTPIPPGEHVLVKTGLKMELPEGYEAQVRPRSGLALKHKITVLNSPGTIDSGYRGEAGVILMNHGKEVFSISKGDRIAQFVIAKHESPEVEEVESLEDSERGEGGFGSTGL